MRTQIMNEFPAEHPWLEHYRVGGSRPIKSEIQEFPFTIGRDPTADLAVESNRVSRKHAAIVPTDHGYMIQDLDSTNGTYVNGTKMAEGTLNDGDVLVLADVELTFFTGQVDGRITATQVMTQPVSGRQSDAVDLVFQVRRLHETLTHRSITSRFQPIVDMDTRDVFGYQAVRELEDTPIRNRQAGAIVEGTECRLTERINQQHRLVAAEMAKRLDDTHLFFSLQVSEVSADFLPEALSRLAEIIEHRHKMVAEIPETAVCDIPYFRQFVEQLRERSIDVAYGGFCGGPVQLAAWSNVAPDYLKLAPPLVKGISRASGGWRKIQTLIKATHELGCAVIADGIEDDADAQCLAELGCQYWQGDHFGGPVPVMVLVDQQLLLASGRP